VSWPLLLSGPVSARWPRSSAGVTVSSVPASRAEEVGGLKHRDPAGSSIVTALAERRAHLRADRLVLTASRQPGDCRFGCRAGQDRARGRCPFTSKSTSRPPLRTAGCPLRRPRDLKTNRPAGSSACEPRWRSSPLLALVAPLFTSGPATVSACARPPRERLPRHDPDCGLVASAMRALRKPNKRGRPRANKKKNNRTVLAACDLPKAIVVSAFPRGRASASLLPLEAHCECLLPLTVPDAVGVLRKQTRRASGGACRSASG